MTPPLAAMSTTAATTGSTSCHASGTPGAAFLRHGQPWQVMSIKKRSLSASSCSFTASRSLAGCRSSCFSSSSGSLNNNDNDNNRKNEKKWSGSNRGRNAVALLPTYLSDARAVEKYHKEDCPHGALQLSVAENQMLEDLLLPTLHHLTTTTTTTPFTADMIYYQPTQGRHDTRQIFATYLSHLLQTPAPLNPDGIVLGAGCNAVLENLCFVLGEVGDAVLVPTPYYAAFEFDLVARAGLKVFPVVTTAAATTTTSSQDSFTTPTPIPEEAYYPTRASLDAAYHQAQQHGHPPKILLLSHPHNPLGICYPPEVLRDCLDWAEEWGVHIISDEIYAGSVYDTTTTDHHYNENENEREERLSTHEGEEKKEQYSSSSSSCAPHHDYPLSEYASASLPFTSMLTIASQKHTSNNNNTNNINPSYPLNLGPNVHLVYALSKDYALSGLRVGALYTENTDIHMPLYKLNDMCSISSQTQALVSAMLGNGNGNGGGGLEMVGSSSPPPPPCWNLLEQSCQRLYKRSRKLQAWCQKLNVPFLKPTAGLYLWLDLREFLPSVDSSLDPVVVSPSSAEMQQQALERELYLKLVKEYGLLLTPGKSMKMTLPGFFRLVFTAASEEEFELALERLERFVGTMRQQQ